MAKVRYPGKMEVRVTREYQESAEGQRESKKKMEEKFKKNPNHE